jgi:hypothetical protein
MNYKYFFRKPYVYFLTSLLAAAFIVEWLALPVTANRMQGLAFSGVLYTLLYLLLRSTYFVVTRSEVARVSYFVFTTRVEVADILAIVFPDTWLSGEMRTLAIVSRQGRKLTMTELAYGRNALADVVRRLLKLNPNIRLDEAATDLLSGEH